jgi:signal transduction histidine kinase
MVADGHIRAHERLDRAREAERGPGGHAPSAQQEPKRYRLGGVRLRSALSAAAVVAVAVALAAWVFIAGTQAALTRNVDAAAQQRADDVAAALGGDDAIDLDDAVRPSAGDRNAVQVLDAAGVVLASSTAVPNPVPLTTLRPAPGRTRTAQSPLPGNGEEPFQIVAEGVTTQNGVRIVVVAQSLRPVIESAEAMTGTLAWGMPALVLIVGLATFFFVGRSLRPVEAIRRRVATITAQELHARVPVPAARDEVAALAATMNAMLDRLEASADAQRRFVADASHELRSPLATIQVGLDVLAGAATTTTGATRLLRLQTEAERLGRLVADLLLLARVDEHGLALRHDDVDLDDLAYAERDRLRAQHPGLRVVSRIEPVRISGDADRLERAVRNLADNAARHAAGEVTLAVWADPDGAHLAVADDGPGIDPADRNRVFERFVRLDDSRARGDGGSGLGLAISREIVAGHGGDISVGDDLPGTDHRGGAVFHLRLPARPARAD